MGEPLRIVFMGSDGIALPLLDAMVPLAETVRIVGVFTQPDRPVGRGQKVQPNAIKVWAEKQGLPVFQPDRLTAEVTAQLTSLQPDLSVVMAYGHILKDDVISAPRLGTVNLHASLLPAYRGASPIQTAVAAGECETGVSLMRIVRRLDAGPVADVERVRIGELDTALDVEGKLAAACVPLVLRNLPRLVTGTLVFTEQHEPEATFCRKLTKEDAQIDWTQPARLVAARINGLNPWPGGAFTVGEHVIKIGLADALEAASGGGAGRVDVSKAGEVRVVAGDGRPVRLRRLQRPGGRMLGAEEFLRGFSFPADLVLPSVPGVPLVGREPFRLPKKGTG